MSTPVDRSSARRKLKLDEQVIQAHDSLVSAAGEIGRAGATLLQRIEELSTLLEELRERYATDLAAAEARELAARNAASLQHERELQELRTLLAVREAEWAQSRAALEAECSTLKDTLRVVYTTLS